MQGIQRGVGLITAARLQKVLQVASTTALVVSADGLNYALQVDTSTPSAVTGLKITSGLAAAGVSLSVISTASSDNLLLDAKGAGQIILGTTSTGIISVQRSLRTTVANSAGLAIAAVGSSWAFQVDTSASNAVTGVKITAAAASAGVAISVISSAGAENLTIDAKSTGTITLAGTSTGVVVVSRALQLGSTISQYSAVTTAGWGVPAIYGSGRSLAQTALVASVATYTVGAADGSFEVSANVLVTTSTTHSITVTVAYTDEGNTARTLTLSFSQLTGAIITAITNVTGAGPYEGVPMRIRCKAATSITIATAGTFTTITYNVEGMIAQVA